MMTRKRLYTIAAVLLAFTCGVLIYFFSRQASDPARVIKTVDSDTNETLYTEPNKTPEIDQTNGDPIILGSYLLLENGMTQDQFTLAKEAINDYSKTKLKGEYHVLKIIPEGFTFSDNVMRTKLKLGDTDKMVTISFEITKLTNVRVVIDNGAYDSGVLTNHENQKSGADEEVTP